MRHIKQIIKYLIKVLILYTPFYYYIKKNSKTYRFKKKTFLSPFIKIFLDECYPRISNPSLQREITDSTLVGGEGIKWAEKFHNQRFKNFKDLENKRVGLISADEAYPIFRDIHSFIIKNKLQEDKDLYLIQLGSCSGSDLNFFYEIFPNINFISTDINDEILDFQKTKYNYKNFKFFKTHAEDINTCFEEFNLYDKKVIIFSVGSLQYVNPDFLELFFNKLNILQDLNLFICDQVSIDFMDNHLNTKSSHRFDIVFNHRYKAYAGSNSKIIKNQIIRPHSKEDNKNFDVAHTYLHIWI